MHIFILTWHLINHRKINTISTSQTTFAALITHPNANTPAKTENVAIPITLTHPRWHITLKRSTALLNLYSNNHARKPLFWCLLHSQMSTVLAYHRWKQSFTNMYFRSRFIILHQASTTHTKKMPRSKTSLIAKIFRKPTPNTLTKSLNPDQTAIENHKYTNNTYFHKYIFLNEIWALLNMHIPFFSAFTSLPS